LLGQYYCFILRVFTRGERACGVLYFVIDRCAKLQQRLPNGLGGAIGGDFTQT